MNKAIRYKNHLIILDGITAKIYYNDIEYIYKMSYLGYSTAQILKDVKHFINNRRQNFPNTRTINIYA